MNRTCRDCSAWMEDIESCYFFIPDWMTERLYGIMEILGIEHDLFRGFLFSGGNASFFCSKDRDADGCAAFKRTQTKCPWCGASRPRGKEEPPRLVCDACHPLIEADFKEHDGPINTTDGYKEKIAQEQLRWKEYRQNRIKSWRQG